MNARIALWAFWIWQVGKTYSSDWRAVLLAVVGAILIAAAAYLIPGAGPLPPIPMEPESSETISVPYTPGWVDDQEAVKAAVRDIEKEQGFPADFGRVYKSDPFADDSSPVFFWTAEEQILGRVLPSLDQGSVGSCVSFAWGRGCQDLMLIQIVAARNEAWPGAEVATEPIYGGSRVEVGGGRLQGDGSTGAWAAKWVQHWGILLRQKYLNGRYDLARYDMARCREWGRVGVPDDLEPLAKNNPVKGVAMVTTPTQAWQAIGSGYPIPVCSGIGFQSPLKEGFCARKGEWAHAMLLRGRFIHPTKGKCFVVQNSWGDYLASGDPYITVQGLPNKVRLPQGCFAITWAEAGLILREKDSYAISAFRGFPPPRIDWLVRMRPEGWRGERPTTRLAHLLERPRGRTGQMVWAIPIDN